MNKLFYYLGDAALPYRKIMAEHTDFVINGQTIHKNKTVIAEQTHSRTVHICKETDSGAGFDNHPQIPDCDALVTNIHNQFLMIRTADCTPVMFYDKVKGCIGAAHSGRESTRKNIVQELIKTMRVAYNSNPADISVWIGAGICKEHYQVNKIIYDEFIHTCKLNGLHPEIDEALRIDVQDIIVQQLTQCGIKPDNITKNDICTFESEAHFSFRKDGTHNRQINVIGLIDG